MAKIYPLQLTNEDDIILVDVDIKYHTAQLVLDTGATNTIFDLNTLLIAGYNWEDIKTLDVKKFETANGKIEAKMVVVDELIVWEKVFKNINVFTIDFIKAGISSEFEGVLGLDLMKQFNLEINFRASELIVS